MWLDDPLETISYAAMHRNTKHQDLYNTNIEWEMEETVFAGQCYKTIIHASTVMILLEVKIPERYKKGEAFKFKVYYLNNPLKVQRKILDTLPAGVKPKDYHVRVYLSNPSALRDSKRRPYITVRPKERRTYSAEIHNTKLLPKVFECKVEFNHLSSRKNSENFKCLCNFQSE